MGPCWRAGHRSGSASLQWGSKGTSRCHGVGDSDPTQQSLLHKSPTTGVPGWGKATPTPSLALGEAIPHKREKLARGTPAPAFGAKGWEGGREGEAGARGAGSAVTQPGVAAGEVFVFSF